MMKKYTLLFAFIISGATVSSQSIVSPGIPDRLCFGKYELSSGGALLLQSKTPTSIKIGQDSVKAIANMPVYKPDPSYNGFLLISDGRRSEHNPQKWLDAIKNNLFEMKDSLSIKGNK